MISQGEGDDHNMINLLDDSASDSQEILKLPPLKSKRSKLFGKKKKPHFEEPPSCIPCKPIKYFFATLAIATLIAVSLVTFVLMQQISNLKKEFQAVERKNQFTPEEFQRLHTQIQELNKTLNYYKSGKNGLQAILQNVTLLSKEVANLKVTSASLQSSLAKAPSLQSLPAEVNAMSNSLKSQGSDLESFKTKVLNQFKNDATNFENLTKSVIELKSDMKQLQTEEKQANNTEINFTKFQKHLNSTESKLQDQIFQLQKQFQMFEFQFNETAIAPTKQTTKQAAESTTSSTIPSTKKV